MCNETQVALAAGFFKSAEVNQSKEVWLETVSQPETHGILVRAKRQVFYLENVLCAVRSAMASSQSLATLGANTEAISVPVKVSAIPGGDLLK